MVRTQLIYIFTQNSTLGTQLHVSALYIGNRQVVQYGQNTTIYIHTE